MYLFPSKPFNTPVEQPLILLENVNLISNQVLYLVHLDQQKICQTTVY